jgi:hypothetical protein
MKRSRRVLLSIVVAPALTLVLGFGVASAKDASKDKKGKATAGDKSAGAAPPGVALNACGCYSKGNACVCTSKKAKCECPGECEPVGCAAKRDKEMEKETADAVKQAQDEDKKREAAEAKKAQDEEKKRQAAEAAEQEKNAASEGDESGPDSADAEKTDKPEKTPAKPAKFRRASGKK